MSFWSELGKATLDTLGGAYHQATWWDDRTYRTHQDSVKRHRLEKEQRDADYLNNDFLPQIVANNQQTSRGEAPNRLKINRAGLNALSEGGVFDRGSRINRNKTRSYHPALQRPWRQERNLLARANHWRVKSAVY